MPNADDWWIRLLLFFISQQWHNFGLKEPDMKGNRMNVFWLSAILSLQVFVSNAQSDVIGLIKETLKAGSAKELSRYLNQTVEVSIDGKDQAYSKPQAEFVFRDFFKQHPPSEFDIIHQGSSPGGQPFAIGQYKSGEEVFRVFIIIKTVNNQQLLNEIKFSKE
jgi:hypothetical protein